MDALNHIRYRQVRDLESLQQMVDLQRLIWGENAEAHIPLHMLHSLAFNGAPILGAFEGDLLVGFSVGFLGIDALESTRPAMANLKLASKRLAVHPDYRGSGIAYRLKVEQRNFAKAEGIRLITWTFDPLISRNAYLYIHKLGAIVREYHPDFYGDYPGQLEAIPNSDRFVVDWWVTSNRVEEKINGKRRDLGLAQYLDAETPLINPAQPGPDGSLLPSRVPITLPNTSLLLVEIPPEPRPLHRDPNLGQQWREHSRMVFQHTLEAGFIITDFLHEQHAGRCVAFM
ncbi:MAG: hypothetical protein HC915_09050 [Anaerolineae bacterium]|nr:hypothetical protein [Anaerolineae bacterium]